MWQGGGDGRDAIWSYPAELGSKSIRHRNAEKSRCDGDNTWQPPISLSSSVPCVSHVPSASAPDRHSGV